MGLISPCVPIYSPDLRRRRSLHLPKAQKVRPSRALFWRYFAKSWTYILEALGVGSSLNYTLGPFSVSTYDGLIGFFIWSFIVWSSLSVSVIKKANMLDWLLKN